MAATATATAIPISTTTFAPPKLGGVTIVVLVLVVEVTNVEIMVDTVEAVR
jgi:hypothetical protein